LSANVVFSLCAGLASLAVALGAALKGAYVVTAVWAVLSLGFVVRAGFGRRGSG
jgi:hypothetical protein